MTTKRNSLKVAKMQDRNGVRGVFIANERTGEVRWIPDPKPEPPDNIPMAPEGWRAAHPDELSQIKGEILAWDKESN